MFFSCYLAATLNHRLGSTRRYEVFKVFNTFAKLR